MISARRHSAVSGGSLHLSGELAEQLGLVTVLHSAFYDHREPQALICHLVICCLCTVVSSLSVNRLNPCQL